MGDYYEAEGVALYLGHCRDVLARLPGETASCVVTSPPFYGPILPTAARASKGRRPPHRRHELHDGVGQQQDGQKRSLRWSEVFLDGRGPFVHE